MKVIKNSSIRIMLAFGALVFAGQTWAIPNCPLSDGNVDVYTRIVDVRSAPGSAGLDFKAVEKAMRSDGPGNLTGVCVQAHSNIPNSLASTQAEARAFGQKIRAANLVQGVPIHTSGHSNSQPVTNEAAEYVNAQGKRVKVAFTPSNIQKAILNHRIEVFYTYTCPISVACVAPYSGLSASPIMSGATLAAPVAAAAAAPAAIGGLGAVAGGLAAAAAIAAALGGGDSGTGTTP